LAVRRLDRLFDPLHGPFTLSQFGDGGAFVAMTGDGAVALAVRCLQKDLSIGVIELGDDPKPMESKETAIRVADSRGVSSTHIFNTKGSRGAFADRSRECPLD
jgi:hypothetical protein